MLYFVKQNVSYQFLFFQGVGSDRGGWFLQSASRDCTGNKSQTANLGYGRPRKVQVRKRDVLARHVFCIVRI